MNGKWITAPKEIVTPRFRKTFTAENIAAASIDISGLGYFTLLINGKKVSDDLFTPAQTNYAPRDLSKFIYPIFDTISCRVLYMTYDVKEYLVEGENTIDVIVGNGWFRQDERKAEGETSYFDHLLAIFDLTLTKNDGSVDHVVTDGTERCYAYPIIEDNLFYGEVLDTRLFDEEPKEYEVALDDFVPERFERHVCTPDRVVRTIKPKQIDAYRTREGANRLLFDAAENISGYAQIRVKGARGASVTLRFTEQIYDNRPSYPSSGGYPCDPSEGRSQIQTDVFILNGEEQVLEPMFVWHAFRYIEIELNGEIEVLEPTVKVIHTAMPVITTFESDNEILNWFYDAFIRTQYANTHGCVPSDCPHRERLGYTGDGQVTSAAVMTIFDSRKMYEKWIDDILDCQNKYNGHVQHTAPFMGGGGGPGGWGGAMVFVPYNFYKAFGDVSMLEKTYEPMKKWIAYLQDHSEGDIIVREEKDGWCLGEWCTPGYGVAIDVPYVNTCCMIAMLDQMAEISDILGKGDRTELESIADRCRKAVAEKYFVDGEYCGGVNGANAFAVWARLPYAETLLGKIREKYEALGGFDTGIIGTPILCRVLCENGMTALCVRMLASDDYDCGFNFMMRTGGTTIFEHWDQMAHSNSHPMLGASSKWLFDGLLGIRAQSGERMDYVVEPCLDSIVRTCSGSVKTACGDLAVRFDVRRGLKKIAVTVPEGLTAKLKVGSAEYPLNAGVNHFVL